MSRLLDSYRNAELSRAHRLSKSESGAASPAAAEESANQPRRMNVTVGTSRKSPEPQPFQNVVLLSVHSPGASEDQPAQEPSTRLPQATPGGGRPLSRSPAALNGRASPFRRDIMKVVVGVLLLLSGIVAGFAYLENRSDTRKPGGDGLTETQEQEKSPVFVDVTNPPSTGGLELANSSSEIVDPQRVREAIKSPAPSSGAQPTEDPGSQGPVVEAEKDANASLEPGTTRPVVPGRLQRPASPATNLSKPAGAKAGDKSDRTRRRAARNSGFAAVAPVIPRSGGGSRAAPKDVSTGTTASSGSTPAAGTPTRTNRAQELLAGLAPPDFGGTSPTIPNSRFDSGADNPTGTPNRAQDLLPDLTLPTTGGGSAANSPDTNRAPTDNPGLYAPTPGPDRAQDVLPDIKLPSTGDSSPGTPPDIADATVVDSGSAANDPTASPRHAHDLLPNTDMAPDPPQTAGVSPEPTPTTTATPAGNDSEPASPPVTASHSAPGLPAAPSATQPGSGASAPVPNATGPPGGGDGASGKGSAPTNSAAAIPNPANNQSPASAAAPSATPSTAPGSPQASNRTNENQDWESYPTDWESIPDYYRSVPTDEPPPGLIPETAAPAPRAGTESSIDIHAGLDKVYVIANPLAFIGSVTETETKASASEGEGHFSGHIADAISYADIAPSDLLVTGGEADTTQRIATIELDHSTRAEALTDNPLGAWAKADTLVGFDRVLAVPDAEGASLDLAWDIDRLAVHTEANNALSVIHHVATVRQSAPGGNAAQQLSTLVGFSILSQNGEQLVTTYDLSGSTAMHNWASGLGNGGTPASPGPAVKVPLTDQFIDPGSGLPVVQIALDVNHYEYSIESPVTAVHRVAEQAGSVGNEAAVRWNAAAQLLEFDSIPINVLSNNDARVIAGEFRHDPLAGGYLEIDPLVYAGALGDDKYFVGNEVRLVGPDGNMLFWASLPTVRYDERLVADQGFNLFASLLNFTWEEGDGSTWLDQFGARLDKFDLFMPELFIGLDIPERFGDDWLETSFESPVDALLSFASSAAVGDQESTASQTAILEPRTYVEPTPAVDLDALAEQGIQYYPVGDEPVAPPVTSTPDTSGPSSNGPDAAVASIPDESSHSPTPVDLPDQPSGPVVASNEPGDDWFSPGNSPGTAVIDGDFTLDGGILLFEVLGTAAGLEYDQLIVNGNVDLNEGNVVIAFIDNFIPQASEVFELILADLINVSDSVNFYYGFFDPAVDPQWSLHAPTNLSMYTQWDISSGISMGVSGQSDQTGKRFTVQNAILTGVASSRNQGPHAGPDEDVEPLVIGAQVPVPAPLLLIAVGILFTATFRRQAQGGGLWRLG